MPNSESCKPVLRAGVLWLKLRQPVLLLPWGKKMCNFVKLPLSRFLICHQVSLMKETLHRNCHNHRQGLEKGPEFQGGSLHMLCKSPVPNDVTCCIPSFGQMGNAHASRGQAALCTQWHNLKSYSGIWTWAKLKWECKCKPYLCSPPRCQSFTC